MKRLLESLCQNINCKVLWILALLLATILSIANILLGDLNQDEGWYLYAAKLVWQGKILYHDFAFPQGPVLPLFYSIFWHLIDKYGLLFGRMLNAVLGLSATVLAAIFANKLVVEEKKQYAGLLAFILIAINVYQSYFFAVVKTYSLAALFCVAGFYSLFYALQYKKIWMTFLSGALFIFAGATRSSGYVIIPIIIAMLCLYNWREWRNYIFAFIGGNIMAALFVILPFLVISYDNFIFFVFKYHTLRKLESPALYFAFKCGFISRVIQAYFVALALLVFAIILKCSKRAIPVQQENTTSNKTRFFLIILLWMVTLAVSLIHFSAPFPYDDYQVFIFPIFVIALITLIIELVHQNWLKHITIAIFCISLASSFSSPINQDWFIQGRNRIWWLPKDMPPLLKLQAVAKYINSLAPEKGTLLTQDPYLAVETGKNLPHGLELGQFSLFPDMSDDEAMKRNVLNFNLFRKLLMTSKAPLAALSGYAFAIKSPDITPLKEDMQKTLFEIVDARYEPVKIVQNFGQAYTTLKIMKLKNVSEYHNNQNSEKGEKLK